MQKLLTLTIVIPAYNEERHLKACLDAIASQTVKPDEVIVVDNNSTDKTMDIAKNYDFVTLITESKQGRGNARTAGFNAAKSDIIGRIDADSVIANNWVERVMVNFSDSSIAGVTGLGRTNIGPFLPNLYVTFWSRVYFWDVHAYFNVNTMWGANCAIRKSNWRLIRDQVCFDDRQVHEDQDVSILIAGSGGEITQDNSLLITTNGRSYAFFPKLFYYGVLRHRTKKLHKHLGTLEQPNAVLLGFWNTLPGRLYSVVPGVAFIITSIILWPLQALILAYNDNLGKPWVD